MYHTFEADEENRLKQKKQEEADRNNDNEITSGKQNPHNTYGAANLSLKHLLAAIESKQDELSITETELSTLLSDVRKNRSKWASEDRIGQEELYEAAEKVVLQLRATTEHSTAFLNKVNKRDAPNYFNIIKHPMDLNTVMKKLKGFQYKSKKEFVDDLMLIWSNCLRYNTDPNHFLRVHANAMRVKTLQLIPLIPDIVVRDRAEVEAEEARLAKEEAESEDEEKEKIGGRVKGTGTGKHAAKGRKRKLHEDTAGAAGSRPSPFPRLESMEASATPRNTMTPGPVTDYEADDSKFESEVVEFPDIESLLYQELYGERALAICSKRAELFKEQQVQWDQPALLRSAKGMAKFEELELDSFKTEEAKKESKQEHRLFNRRGFISSIEDNDDILVEYSSGVGLPPVPWAISNYNKTEGLENVSLDDIGQSGYVNRTGLTPHVLANLQEMQHIRKICFKIGVIRQMQQQAYMHSAQLKPYHPDDIIEPDLDVESRLPNRDCYDEEVSRVALRRNMAKIAMHSGFEETEIMAVDALTEIAADYMGKLGRSIKLWMETSEPSTDFTMQEILLNVLEENGIESISSLEFYIKNDIERHHQRLVDQKKKLALFVADLLRPGSQEYNDTEFKDGSEQFLTGDFSEEIGDDFFGFRELGLDQELGLESLSVPLHLLQSRFALANMQNTVTDDHEHQLEVPEYSLIDKNVAERQITPIKNFLLKRFEISSATTLTGGGQDKDGMHTDGILTLLEGDQLPAKLRNSRPKVPPTGKLPGVKKKQPSKVFHRPPPPPWMAKSGSGESGGGPILPGGSQGSKYPPLKTEQADGLSSGADGLFGQVKPDELDLGLFGNGTSGEFGFLPTFPAN